jgi:hypothetical protein
MMPLTQYALAHFQGFGQQRLGECVPASVQIEQTKVIRADQGIGCVTNYRTPTFCFNPQALFTGVSGQ